jgi:hypothetical protein
MSIDLSAAFDNKEASEIVKIIYQWFSRAELIDFAEDEFSVHDHYNESEKESREDEEEEKDSDPWEELSQEEKADYIFDYLECFSPDLLVMHFLAVLSSDDIRELAEKYFPDFLDDDEDEEDEEIKDEEIEDELLEEEEEW